MADIPEYQEVRHYQVNGLYKVQFERAATKGVIGYKVEANGDDKLTAFDDAKSLMIWAETVTPSPVREEKWEVK